MIKNCKRCTNKSNASAEEIEKAVARIKNMSGVKLVDENIYEKRFKICMNCTYLEYGSTCMLCGCLVQVRGRLSDGNCPYPKNNKWVEI